MNIIELKEGRWLPVIGHAIELSVFDNKEHARIEGRLYEVLHYTKETDLVVINQRIEIWEEIVVIMKERGMVV